MTDVTAALEGVKNEVANFIKASNEEIQSHGKLGRENKAAMTSLEAKLADLSEQVLDLEQSRAARGAGFKAPQTAGQQFVDSPIFASLKSGAIDRARFEIQNNTILGDDATVAPDRLAGVVAGASRRLRMVDIIPGGVTGSNAVEYTRENVFTNAAAETAEGVAKPESAVTFTLVNTPVRTIAHWLKMSKQVIDDAPMIKSYIDTRLAFGVQHRYDSQLLIGNGTAPNLSGLMDGGNYTVFTANGTDRIVSIRQAIAQVELADYAATAVILNPTDLQAIDLTRTLEGLYVAANPRTGDGPMIWGLPIVTSNAIAAGQFLTGAFDMAAMRFERQGVTVEMFEQDDTNVQQNLVTLRGEMRAALAVFRPASLVGGALST